MGQIPPTPPLVDLEAAKVNAAFAAWSEGVVIHTFSTGQTIESVKIESKKCQHCGSISKYLDSHNCKNCGGSSFK